MVKNPPAYAGDARDMSSIPGSGRSSGVVNDNTLQYSCLENSMDRGTWQATELWWSSTESDTTKCLHTHMRSLFSAKEHPTCQSTVSKNVGDTRPCGGYSVQFSSFQSLSRVWLFATPWTAAHQASLSITNSQSLFKLTSIESVMPSNHLILCHPLLLLPSIFPRTRVFTNELVLHIRWPKYWSFTFNISPSNEYSGLISFKIEWLDLLAVQGTLKSLLQHHDSKASILQPSAFL